MQLSYHDRSFDLYSPPSRAGYPIYAQPDKYGALDVDHLHDYFVTWVDPYLLAKQSDLFVLDFSLVQFWDISALLWLVIALHYYKIQGLNFLLRLPEPKNEMTNDDRTKFQKSADFLRRWQLDEGLRNITSNVSCLLVPEQVTYFDIEPKEYSAATIRIARDIKETLLSKRLAPIRNLVDLQTPGPIEVTDAEIGKCISEFQTARIGDILERQCGLEKRKADLFSDHLLTEGLVNVKEHPAASIGMIAVSVLGASGELVLAIADNGYPIPRTIYDRFLESEIPGNDDGLQFPASYDKKTLKTKQRTQLVDFATWPGVSRKRIDDPRDSPTAKADSQYEIGMGLYYIKEDTVNTFGGRFMIVSGGVSVEYSRTSSRYTAKNCRYRWRGNLLRISIPISIGGNP